MATSETFKNVKLQGDGSRANAPFNEVGGRIYQRHPTRLHAILFCRGKFQTTTIHDLSQGGAGLTGAFGVMPRDEVAIEFLNGKRLTAAVRWWVNGRCGIVFDIPLQADDPLLRKALKRSPQTLTA